MAVPVLSLHDTADFPIVRFLSDLAVAGYGRTWCADMDALVDIRKPFVLIYLPRRLEEAHEDRKIRGVWLKENKERLAAACLGLIAIEPDAARRAEVEAMLPGLVRAFGTPQAATATLTEAEMLARQLVAGETRGLST